MQHKELLMDKEFILAHLKPEHLKDNESLKEIYELSGLETVKLLLRNHETLQLYVPRLHSLPDLMRDVVEENKNTMDEHKLRQKTDLSRKTMSAMLRRIKRK